MKFNVGDMVTMIDETGLYMSTYDLEYGNGVIVDIVYDKYRKENFLKVSVETINGSVSLPYLRKSRFVLCDNNEDIYL